MGIYTDPVVKSLTCQTFIFTIVEFEAKDLILRHEANSHLLFSFFITVGENILVIYVRHNVYVSQIFTVPVKPFCVWHIYHCVKGQSVMLLASSR